MKSQIKSAVYLRNMNIIYAAQAGILVMTAAIMFFLQNPEQKVNKRTN